MHALAPMIFAVTLAIAGVTAAVSPVAAQTAVPAFAAAAAR